MQTETQTATTEERSEVTGTTTYADHTTLSLTAAADTDYLLMFSGVGDSNSAGVRPAKYRFQNDTSGTTYNEFNFMAKDNTDKFGIFGMKKITGSSSSVSLKGQFAPTNTADTAGFANVNIVAVQLKANDHYAEADTETTTTSTSYGDQLSTTLSVPSEGDYLIIAMAETFDNSAGTRVLARLFDGTTAYGESTKDQLVNSGVRPWGTMVKLTLPAGDHTLKIQYASGTSGQTVRMRNARLVAFRLDDFANNYYAEARATSTDNSGSYQDKATLTQTTLAKAHVVFANGQLDNQSTTVSGHMQLLEDSIAASELIYEGNTSSYSYPYFAVYKKTLTAEEHTWKLQYKGETNAITVGAKEAAISVLQTEP